jgi:hypothetical protein
VKRLAGLVLLGTPMVIHRQQAAPRGTAAQAEVHGGLATVAADLQRRRRRIKAGGTAIQQLALGAAEKSLDAVDVDR